jgi:hypothetical protein
MTVVRNGRFVEGSGRRYRRLSEWRSASVRIVHVDDCELGVGGNGQLDADQSLGQQQAERRASPPIEETSAPRNSNHRWCEDRIEAACQAEALAEPVASPSGLLGTVTVKRSSVRAKILKNGLAVSIGPAVDSVRWTPDALLKISGKRAGSPPHAHGKRIAATSIDSAQPAAAIRRAFYECVALYPSHHLTMGNVSFLCVTRWSHKDYPPTQTHQLET